MCVYEGHRCRPRVVTFDDLLGVRVHEIPDQRILAIHPLSLSSHDAYFKRETSMDQMEGSDETRDDNRESKFTTPGDTNRLPTQSLASPQGPYDPDCQPRECPRQRERSSKEVGRRA